MQDQIAKQSAVVAVFDDHASAEAAVRKLAEAGVDLTHVSIVGKGYHSDEHVTGFYNTGDRVEFWGSRGAAWGGLWGLLFGGAFLTLPVTGPIVVIGALASMVIGALEGAVVVGGLSALGAAIYSIGIPKDSVIAYETAIKADKFVVTVHGSANEVDHAKIMLHTYNAASVDHHDDLIPGEAGPMSTSSAPVSVALETLRTTTVPSTVKPLDHLPPAVN
jgi:hypothetical protein